MAYGDPEDAGSWARRRVAEVRGDPDKRLSLLHGLYQSPTGNGRTHLPYRRAASSFMQWQLRRGLLGSSDASKPGSPWWRAVNERLLLDGCEARALALGSGGSASSAGVQHSLEFIRRPSARSWYRAHNTSIVSAYLENLSLAEDEDRVERFFINLVLIRVLYAHALVAAPRLAMGRLEPLGPVLGDPRLGMTGIFLSLSRVLPDRYPLGDDVDRYVAAEHGFGHLLDVGMIQPRLGHLFDWSASELDVPELRDLIAEGIPRYAWDPSDRRSWTPPVSRLARAARRAVPASQPR